jgi:hypothetical protein
MDNENLEKIKKQNKRLSIWLVIITTLLCLSLIFIVNLYITNHSFPIEVPDTKLEEIFINTEKSNSKNYETKNNDTESKTESDMEERKYDVTFSDSSGQIYGINIEGFEKTDDIGDPIWPSHQATINDEEHLSGSSNEILSYYRNLEILLQVNADDLNFEIRDINDLKRVEGLDNAYYLQQKESSNGNAPSGSILVLEPKIKVQNLNAFKIIEYYNIIDAAQGDTSYVPSNYSEITSINCIISLDQVDPDSEGFIEYSGIHSAGSTVNYCDALNELKEFSIIVE